MIIVRLPYKQNEFPTIFSPSSNNSEFLEPYRFLAKPKTIAFPISQSVTSQFQTKECFAASNNMSEFDKLRPKSASIQNLAY